MSVGASIPLLLAAPGAATTLVYDGATLRSLTRGPGGPTDILRPGTVSDEELAGRTAEQIAGRLKAEIDRRPRPGFTPHVVAIDEIGNAFRDPRPRTRYRTVTVRGTRFRIASHNRIRVTRDGWRLVKRPPTPPIPGPAHPGVRLSEAMAMLEATPSPWGGTYAARVHLLVAPAMVTAIGAGRGPHFTLNRAGSRAVRAAWRGVMPALARSGGVWLAMYHGGRRPLSALQWRRAPGRFASYLARHGGRRSLVHLLLTSVERAPRGSGACGSPMACQWSLARTGATRRLLANGVGAYRLEEDAPAWLEERRRSVPR